MNKKALTTYDIATHCHVTPRTVIQWINEGKIKAYRTPGNHSRVQMADFMIFLKEYNMPLPEQLPASETHIGIKRILIVDDDRSMVDTIYRILQREKDYELDVAYDGFEAGEKFAGFKPDLVLIDIRMPGLNGYELCARIRDNHKNSHVKILLISGSIERQDIELAKIKGADDYLEKPFTNAALRSKIEALLYGQR